MNKKKQVSKLLTAFSFAILLSACGSKGDLYHEEQENPQANEEKNQQHEESQSQNKGQ